MTINSFKKLNLAGYKLSLSLSHISKWPNQTLKKDYYNFGKVNTCFKFLEVNK